VRFSTRQLAVLVAAPLFSLVALLSTAHPVSEPPAVSLALLGDVMLGRGVAQVHTSSSWEGSLSYLAPALQSADLALANLESPLSGLQNLSSGTVQEGYNLCAPSKSALALVSVGVDVLTLANNHTDDCPSDSTQNTASLLADHDLQSILPGEPLSLTIRNIPLAFLVFDDISSPLDPESLRHSIESAGKDGSLVVVSIHWGSEYHPGPDERQRMLATVMAEAGAALVWGHHPHVLQTTEWLQRGGHDGPTLVIYSLGNTLFDQVTPPDSRRSALMWVILDASGVRSAEAFPFEIDALNGEVVPATADTAAAVLDRLDINSSMLFWHP